MNDILAPKPRSAAPLRDTTQRLRVVKKVLAASTANVPEARPALNLPAPDPDGLPRKKRSKLKWLWLSLLALIVLLAVAAGAGYWWYQDNLQARSSSSERIRVKVESGETSDAVAGKLERNGVIRSSLAMMLYMKLNGKAAVKSGSYLFMPNQTPQEIAEWLNDGRVDTFKVTILPGQSLAKIKKGLVTAGYDAKAVDAALAKTYNHPLLTGKPAGASLEGYIYPETYFVTSDTSVEKLLTITFDEFQKQLAKTDVRQALADAKLTLYQGVTLASIIEREVVAKDQRQVSQVFHKRLAEAMPLGADATYDYAAAQLGVAPSPQIESPYNTRKYVGLPPGPIANFPVSTLEATAHPADGSYLYFVSGDDGNTYFAHTFAEHEANISKYCHKLCAN